MGTETMKIELTDTEAKFLVRVLECNYAEEQDDFDHNTIACYGGTSSKLVDKLLSAGVSAGIDLHTSYEQAHRASSSQELLNAPLFCGAGYHSKLALNKLHRRLNFAAIQLSGMQQNGGMGTEFDEGYNHRATRDIKDVLRDFALAFDGLPKGIW